MRLVIVLSIGLALIVASANRADEKARKESPEQPPQPSKESYFKVRVEVEVRGVLNFSDKATTVTARYPIFELGNDNNELPDARTTQFTLDFDRTKDLREVAKTLNGKEVVITGLSELRMVAPPRRPGGETGAGIPGPIPGPTWSLQQTVQVTGLKLAGNK